MIEERDQSAESSPFITIGRSDIVVGFRAKDRILEKQSISSLDVAPTAECLTNTKKMTQVFTQCGKATQQRYGRREVD